MAEQKQDELALTDSDYSFADSLVNWLKKKKLEMPATILLEGHRPLMPLAHPAACLAGPFVAPFFGPDYYEKIEALRDPVVFDRMLERLTERADDEQGETQNKAAGK
ncbi:hypothetical protein ACFL34_01300 [Candidatus Sumerlaeota bacterium]